MVKERLRIIKYRPFGRIVVEFREVFAHRLTLSRRAKPGQFIQNGTKHIAEQELLAVRNVSINLLQPQELI